MYVLGAIQPIHVEDFLIIISIWGAIFGAVAWIVKLSLEFNKRFDSIERDREKLKGYWSLSLQRIKDELRWHDSRINHLEQFEQRHGFVPRSKPPTNPDGIEFWNNNTDEDETQIPH